MYAYLSCIIRFLVLEYVEGGELFDYLVKSGRLMPNEVSPALTFYTIELLTPFYTNIWVVIVAGEPDGSKRHCYRPTGM